MDYPAGGSAKFLAQGGYASTSGAELERLEFSLTPCPDLAAALPCTPAAALAPPPTQVGTAKAKAAKATPLLEVRGTPVRPAAPPAWVIAHCARSVHVLR